MKIVKAVLLSGLVAVIAFESPAQDLVDRRRDAPTATVYPKRLRFALPIADIHRTWTWGAAKRDRREYSWMVSIKAGSAEYQLGFSYFNQGSPIKRGTLSQLLRAGQSNLWRLSNDGSSGSLVQGVRVRARVEGNELVFEVRSKKWTERLFKSKPAEVTFETSGTELPESSVTCRVQYIAEKD